MKNSSSAYLRLYLVYKINEDGNNINLVCGQTWDVDCLQTSNELNSY